MRREAARDGDDKGKVGRKEIKTEKKGWRDQRKNLRERRSKIINK